MTTAPTPLPGESLRRLGGFTGTGYDKGRPVAVQAAWFVVLNLVFMKWWCPAWLRVTLLRAFGAHVGSGVLVRHRVRVLWPWKLTVGDDVWIGEGAWILNVDPVLIENDVCVSQEALLCSGSHDRLSPTFEFDNAPIVLRRGCWIAARSTVLRGADVPAGAVVGAGTVYRRRASDD